MTTRSTEELGDFAAAAAKAVAEMEGQTPPVDTDPALSADDVEAPSGDGQADGEVGEQAEEPTESATQPQEAEDDEVEEIFGDLEDEVEPASDEPAFDPFEYEFDLPGEEEPVSFQELIDGRMRQRDYTQKTQELAEARKANEQATRLWDALQENPVEVVRKLAVDAGLVAADGQPVAELDLSPFRTTEQVEAEIAKRVEAELATHPLVQKAQLADVEASMNAAFAAIERKYEVPLGPKSRREILIRAQKSGTPDLELVFNAMLAQRQARATTADDLRAAAPSRTTGRSTKTAPNEPQSIEEAWELAEVSHGAGG